MISGEHKYHSSPLFQGQSKELPVAGIQSHPRSGARRSRSKAGNVDERELGSTKNA